MKPETERLDQLTRQRLSRLGRQQVDTDSLERRLEAHLWQAAQPPRAAHRWSPKLTPMAMAAALLIAVGLALVFRGGTPVVAAPIVLAQLHRDLVAGQVPLVPVSTIAEANRYLATEWDEAPPLPNPAAATVTSCCRRNLQKRNVACVLLDYRDHQVTMMVGRSRDVVCGAKHRPMTHHGKEYAVHEADGLQMVMIENKGRWICLMSDAPLKTLISLADSLRFQ